LPRSSRFDRTERFDVVLIATVLVLAGVTAAMLLFPSLRLRIVAPSLDLVLDSVAFVVTISIVALAWVRYRERREPFALFQCAAFLALAIANGRAIIETIGPDVQSPLSTDEPGQAQLYVFTIARMLTAAFLVVGGVAALHGRRPRYPYLLIGGSAALMIGVTIWVLANGSSLTLFIAQVEPVAGDPSHPAPLMTPIGITIQLLGALLFGAAALVCREMWRRDRSIGDAYVTFGLALAAFAQILGAMSPSTHPGPVASGDLLRMGFYLALLLAIEAEARSILGALRRANETLAQLRESEVERAALEERAWLSRELHDGLAQDLWLAKLKVGRLSGLELAPEARMLVGEIGGAIELGLTEARQAVMALRIAAESEDTFGALMSRYVEDFEDRFGLRVEFNCTDVPTLPVRTQAELLRIAQEALTNARRHADATIVRVRVDTEGDRVRLVIADNGRGFDQAKALVHTFGLAAMRERAALIGGDLTVVSAPGNGTNVQLTAPLARATGGST
jgi:signal transduction histidine kinase